MLVFLIPRISTLAWVFASLSYSLCASFFERFFIIRLHRSQMHTMEQINLHSHAIPAAYRQDLIENGHSNPDGMPAIPVSLRVSQFYSSLTRIKLWTPEAHIELIAANNISTSILSIPSPGTCVSTPEINIAIIRAANGDLAAICHQHPSKFHFFASLPLTSIPVAVEEIDRALNSLDAVGLVVLSNI